MQEHRPCETHIGIFGAIIAFIALIWAIAVGFPEFRKQYITQPTLEKLNGPKLGREPVTNQMLPIASEAETNQFIGEWCSIDKEYESSKVDITAADGLFFLKLLNKEFKKLSDLENRPVSLMHPFKQGNSFIFGFSDSTREKGTAIVASIKEDYSFRLQVKRIVVEAAFINQTRQTVNSDNIWHMVRC